MADMLATPADLATLLQRDVDTASATAALEIATAVIQATAGQRIVYVTGDTAVVYGGRDQILRLPEQPVVAVTSVTYQGSPLASGTASGTWRTSPTGIWRDIGWAPWCSSAPSPVTVVYSHGYQAGAQALQLGRGAALSLARGLFVNADGVVREQIDDYSVAYEKASQALDASPSLGALIQKQYGRKAAMVRVI